MNIRVDLLDANHHTRSGKPMSKIEGLVYHWVAGPKQSAAGVRNYFNGLDDRYASANYIIDSKETIQTIPDNEMSYHCGAKAYNDKLLKRLGITYPNAHMIGIELCHDDWSGEFSQEVLQQAIDLGIHLCKKHNLDGSRIFRHYDISYKNCPRWFVNNPNEWTAFYRRIQEGLK